MIKNKIIFTIATLTFQNYARGENRSSLVAQTQRVPLTQADGSDNSATKKSNYTSQIYNLQPLANSQVLQTTPNYSFQTKKNYNVQQNRSYVESNQDNQGSQQTTEEEKKFSEMMFSLAPLKLVYKVLESPDAYGEITQYFLQQGKKIDQLEEENKRLTVENQKTNEAVILLKSDREDDKKFIQKIFEVRNKLAGNNSQIDAELFSNNTLSVIDTYERNKYQKAEQSIQEKREITKESIKKIMNEYNSYINKDELLKKIEGDKPFKYKFD